MLLQLHFERHEVVDRVKSEQVSISAADKDVLLNLLGLEVAHRDCTSNCFVPHWLNLGLLFQ